MNIYKQTARRLNVFTDINDQFNKDEQINGFVPNELTFFGDATAYEKYLDFEIKKLKAEEKESAQQMEMMNQ